ncbi:MAG: CoA ester lyase [Chloroflexota bacterium]|jgi:citrate lyase subunit beta/citryl-CoA lyase|tara:strand:+ start:8478 stop:9380 length:903 start_codon:yes stop_codon:yes gene_type:complete
MINEPLIRSLLFIPGNQPKMLAKASSVRPDAFVLDMEDSVPISEKANAREIVAGHIENISETGVPIIPRVNSLSSGLIDDDLNFVVGSKIWGISVGKIDTPGDLVLLDRKISKLERRSGVQVGKIKLLAWLETALGVVNSRQICSDNTRLAAVCFGAEDFTNDMEIPRHALSPEVDNPALLYPRTVIPVCAKAAGIIALDTPYFGYKDQAGLIKDCQNAKMLGFAGKFAIHPSQIDTINEVFSPSEQEYSKALREIDAFEQSEAQGRGSTSLQEQVIDVPVVERARKLISKYESIFGKGN